MFILYFGLGNSLFILYFGFWFSKLLFFSLVGKGWEGGGGGVWFEIFVEQGSLLKSFILYF